ncbi:MAG: tetratricopeptide repeat protein [Gammaproteobacteria bacterium]|nr:tetratricopeptide repeat protein [Gammaproteobacteria bacterium]MDH3465816.1 tetratricopeptide repeat protein [Gammaproteobacteria bacterium]
MRLRLFPALALLASLSAVTTTAIAAESPAVNPFFAKAEQLYAEGDIDLALELYAKGLELTGNDVDAHIRYASLLQQQGRNSDALAAIEAGLKQNDASADLHVRLANLLQQTGRLEDAYQHYQTAYKLEPESDAGVDAYVQIARITKQNDSKGDGKAEIEWSQGVAPAKPTSTGSGRIQLTPETLGEFSLLHQRLQGEWCLEWVDVYKRDAGACRSQIDNGDFLFVNPPSPVSFQFGDRKVLTAANGLELGSGIDISDGTPKSIDSEIGDRTWIQTVSFTDGRYIEFHFGNQTARSCFLVSAATRGEEQISCADTFTVCRCPTNSAQASGTTGG